MLLRLLAMAPLAAFIPHAPQPRLAPHSCARRAASLPAIAMNFDEDHWTPEDDEMLLSHLQQRTSNARLGKPHTVLTELNAAWVLIFNAGKSDEGVYTLQGKTSHASAYVLAFERTEDATRFAHLLQAEGFDQPTPLCWEREQLVAFCDAGQFEVSLVPTGALITPPTKNEYDVDAFERMNSMESPQQADGYNDPSERFSTYRPKMSEFDLYEAERAAFERLYNLDDRGSDGSSGGPNGSA